MADIVNCKVATLFVPSQVVLNVGREQGITDGSVAKLVEWIDVTDPDSGEYLGKVGRVSLTLRVTSVQERLCVASVTDTYHVRTTGSARPIARRKTITDEPGGGDINCVPVEVGDPATIEIKNLDDLGEEPF